MMRSRVAVLEWAAAGPPSTAEVMGKTEQKPSEPGEAPREPEGEGVDHAFDLWLRRGLHQLYDKVAKEPIPEELLRLIEEDRDSQEE